MQFTDYIQVHLISSLADLLMYVFYSYLSTGSKYRSINYGFRIGYSTIPKIIRETVLVIWNVLSPKYLNFPTKNEFKKISNDYRKKTKFPNVLGAIDGKYQLFLFCSDHLNSLQFNLLFRKTLCHTSTAENRHTVSQPQKNV